MTAANPGTALVTGAAKRIGRVIAKRLARAGYAVAIHRNDSTEDAASLKREIEADGGRAAVLAADLADVTQAARVVRDAVTALGPLTLLINNASIFERDEIDNLSIEKWNRQMAINLASPIFLAQAFAAQAPAGRSSIVNLLDQRVFKLTPLFFSYSLSKSALYAATRTLAQALAPNIRVNGVAPGPTLPSPRQSAEDFKVQNSKMPLGHGATADEVAEAVLYLATTASITGAVIPVDGGQHIAWKTPDIRDARE
jgi:NAD(P)-dependent dehydrogenase (short-subunit alcohol dehydrogenase family)